MNKEDYECFIECYERVKELSKDKTLYKVLNNNEKIICKKTKIQQSSHHQIS